MTIASANIPGLRSDERGFATGDAIWPLARVRVTPVHSDPGIARDVNGPVATRQIVVQLSVSLVDANGAVLRIGGRLMVQDATRHVWTMGGPKPFDAAAWLTSSVARDVASAVAMANDLAAADAAGLLAPVVVPAGTALLAVAGEPASRMAKLADSTSLAEIGAPISIS